MNSTQPTCQRCSNRAKQMYKFEFGTARWDKSKARLRQARTWQGIWNDLAPRSRGLDCSPKTARWEVLDTPPGGENSIRNYVLCCWSECISFLSITFFLLHLLTSPVCVVCLDSSLLTTSRVNRESCTHFVHRLEMRRAFIFRPKGEKILKQGRQGKRW